MSAKKYKVRLEGELSLSWDQVVTERQLGVANDCAGPYYKWDIVVVVDAEGNHYRVQKVTKLVKITPRQVRTLQIACDLCKHWGDPTDCTEGCKGKKP
jgi:hypothetical protein